MQGIYKLVFENGQFYIGQSSNIEKRVKHHIYTQGKGCPKLEAAFSVSTYTHYEVLLECDLEDLNDQEVRLIKEFQPPLNTLPGGTALRGLNHPRSKYSEKQILDMLHFFTTTNMSYQELTNTTGIQTSTIHDIVKLRSHQWVTQYYSKESLDNGIDFRGYKRITKIYDKQGNLHIIDDYAEFTTKHNLNQLFLTQIGQSAKGAKDGWSLYPPDIYIVTSPEKDTIELTLPQLEDLISELNISNYQKNKLLKQQNTSLGWKFVKKNTLEKNTVA